MGTEIAKRLAERIRAGLFTETATLKRQAAGSYVRGKWEAGAETSSTIKIVTAPLSGQERLALPEGLRQANVRKFYVATEVRAGEEGGGTVADVIGYDGKEWRAVIVQDWGGFWEVTGEQA